MRKEKHREKPQDFSLGINPQGELSYPAEIILILSCFLAIANVLLSKTFRFFNALRLRMPKASQQGRIMTCIMPRGGRAWATGGMHVYVYAQ
jgi:hypothetical protein